MRVILFTTSKFWQRCLEEFMDVFIFNDLTYWLPILALEMLRLLTVVKQTSLVTVNGLTNLLTLLTLQAFYSMALPEHTALTGLHWYKRFTDLIKDETSILLAVTSVPIFYQHMDRITNSGQQKKFVLLKGKANNSWNELVTKLTI